MQQSDDKSIPTDKSIPSAVNQTTLKVSLAIPEGHGGRKELYGQEKEHLSAGF